MELSLHSVSLLLRLWSIMCCSNVIVANKVSRPLPLQGLEGEERKIVATEED